MFASWTWIGECVTLGAMHNSRTNALVLRDLYRWKEVLKC